MYANKVPATKNSNECSLTRLRNWLISCEFAVLNKSNLSRYKYFFFLGLPPGPSGDSEDSSVFCDILVVLQFFNGSFYGTSWHSRQFWQCSNWGPALPVLVCKSTEKSIKSFSSEGQINILQNLWVDNAKFFICHEFLDKAPWWGICSPPWCSV